MLRFYFTFGVGQANANSYVVIDAPDWEAARVEMVIHFGRKWAFQYDELGWNLDGVSQADKYQLQQLDYYEVAVG